MQKQQNIERHPMSENRTDDMPTYPHVPRTMHPDIKEKVTIIHYVGVIDKTFRSGWHLVNFLQTENRVECGKINNVNFIVKIQILIWPLLNLM